MNIEKPQAENHSSETYDESAAGAMIDDFCEQQHANIDELSEIENPDFQHEMIEQWREAIKQSFDDEAYTYMELLSPEQLKGVIKWIARDIAHQYEATGQLFRRQGYGESDKINAEGVYNLAQFVSVRGYNNEALNERKESAVPPTAAEILMGCYGEQIEHQTRDAVFSLRNKGYNTIESGFKNKQSGSQFFHLSGEEAVEVPPDVIREIEEQFGVQINIAEKEIGGSSHTYIYFTGATGEPLSLDDWKEVLDAFADKMPEVGEPAFSVKGETVDFAFNALQNFSKEEILETATTENEHAWIEKLYSCNDREEVETLIGLTSEEIHDDDEESE